MKKYIIAFTTIAFFASCNNNQQESHQQDSSQTVNTEVTSESGTPTMKFEEDVYDFGKIKDGEKVSYDFKFKNEGNTPLIIKDATATCGCTVPEWTKEPIGPGQSGKISVIFDSSGKSGLQDKVITITANTVPAQTQIHIIGEIIK
jgi:hypothetical protein